MNSSLSYRTASTIKAEAACPFVVCKGEVTFFPFSLKMAASSANKGKAAIGPLDVT